MTIEGHRHLIQLVKKNRPGLVDSSTSLSGAVWYDAKDRPIGWQFLWNRGRSACELRIYHVEDDHVDAIDQIGNKYAGNILRALRRRYRAPHVTLFGGEAIAELDAILATGGCEHESLFEQLGILL